MAGLDKSLEPMRDFRRHVVDISGHLQPEEANQLGYIHLLPKPQYEGKSALAVLVSLEMQGYFSDKTPEKLVEILKKINRVDLVKMSQSYIKKTARYKNTKKQSDRAADRSTVSAHFEVTFIQNQIMMGQLERLKSVVREQSAKTKVDEAKSIIEQLKRLLQQASYLAGIDLTTSSDEEDCKSIGRETYLAAVVYSYFYGISAII